LIIQKYFNYFNSALLLGIKSSKPISDFGLSWMWGIAGDIQWTTDTYTGTFDILT